ncbi:hypothetical protein HMPREF2137_02660 [Hoylesella buccalis DNF00853]|uniref:Uncharacterized protein n=1 Tax=Hoylesella buccalis DNF00853 TaxID=1401074 RepID=A0A096B040_9BACT|nr:hypothetical protein HMPREF2137_02660 [Hoylesella buccalis DNF00853]
MCINRVSLRGLGLPACGKVTCLLCLLLLKKFTPARQFVEYFVKKWLQKWLFKTFNLEKTIGKRTANKQLFCA